MRDGPLPNAADYREFGEDMKFGTARVEGRDLPFVIAPDGRWIALSSVTASAAPSLTAFIALGEGAFAEVEGAVAAGRGTEIDQASARLLAPIPRPAKNVFCVGRNYVEHIAEDNRTRDLQADLPKYPQFFTKPATAVVGPDAEVRLDEKVTRRLDYEVELAVIIGKTGRDIAAEAVEDHIFGYTICNDITARELQAKHGQWFKGKALDDSCPLGPFIVHAGELSLARAQSLAISLSVNGDLRQNATTADMIFDIKALITSLSAGMTLEAGDIIATGTPSGVGYAMDPRQYLKDGDVIECRIESIGTLTNRIVAA
jgi:2-keto-4-pentenoate hydratase/2-oxohepta-3-ene-1,7-dioic acid hydratase in catechol pathway